jgi:predicted DCC family thiol-disulfide oxidoreductase YuxK
MKIINNLNKNIILFDGKCKLCDFSVNFLLDRDDKDIFRFCTIQSDVGKEILKYHKLPENDISTVVLIENDKAYTKSTAALQSINKIKRPWKYISYLLIIPQFIRDPIYDVIAKNRYHMFGQNTKCRIMTDDIKHKFIDKI